jgi:hypothetical protein
LLKVTITLTYLQNTFCFPRTSTKISFICMHFSF